MRHRAVKPLAPLPWWIAAWTSVGFHAVVLGFVALGGGLRDAGGEGGVAGAGGDTVEVTVVASRERPGTETEAEAAAPTDVERETETETAAAPQVLLAPDRIRDRDRVRVREASPEPAAPEPTTQEAEPEAQQATVATDGRSDANRSGLAAGDAEAAAAILGSVGIGLRRGVGARPYLERTCDDPIEGVWVSHRYRPGARAWARFTLRIERDGERLHGTIMSRTWSGFATDRRPPPCRPDGYDQTYRMVASGTVHGDEFSFGATTHQLVRTDCPSLMMTSYAPDRFRGTVDEMREVLDTLNNDGRYDIDAPYTFRRTACLGEE